jgi:hypothetical protein
LRGRLFRIYAVCLVVASARPGAASAAGPIPAPQGAPAAGAAAHLAALPLDPLVRELVSPTAPPAGVHRALADAVRGFSADLGVVRDPTAELSAAYLSDRMAGLLWEAVDALHACDRLTHRLLADQPFLHGVAAETALPAESVRQIRTCALHTEQVGLHLESVLPQVMAADGPGDVDIWPVLRLSPFGEGHVYVHDYALLVDIAGRARFLNNGGANLMDLKRGPAPWALRHEPSRGCMEPYPDSMSGRVVRGPDGRRQMSKDGPECVMTAAMLIAMGGNDTYGALLPPAFPDDQCTTDPVDPRMATAGSGTGGVGILIEHGGGNTFYGRAQSEGAGHLGGVGLLLDHGPGNNLYVAAASSQGMGLLGGTGILVDNGRNNRYDYYSPRPLNPRAQNHQDGAGGFTNDLGFANEFGDGQHMNGPERPDGQPGGVCDNVERSLQGVGLLSGVGVLLATGGNNTYRALERPEDTDFFHRSSFPGGAAEIIMSHCNQGCGLMTGSGVLVDVHPDGRDAYLNEAGRPWSTHRDGIVLGPQVSTQPGPEGATDLGQLNCSYFVDTPPRRRDALPGPGKAPDLLGEALPVTGSSAGRETSISSSPGCRRRAPRGRGRDGA